MRESELRRLLLARACEEVDPAGRFVPHAARGRAGRAARAALGADPASDTAAARYLATRAERLLAEAAREHPALAGAERVAGVRVPVWAVAAAGFALGLALDALGRERAISLLAFPLLGVMLWNVAVLVGMAVGAVSGRAPAAPAAWVRLAETVRLRTVGRGAGDRAFVARAALRFAELWRDAAGALDAARARARLHVGAACCALGVVAGMYVAGFAFEYRATWESTFLGPEGVHRFLSVVLGPASALLRLPLPDVAGIAALEAPGAGAAAPWIHRWAVTALLVVVVPRVLLAARAFAAARAGALGLAPDLAAPAFARVLAEFRGEGADVRVLPYSVELGPDAATRLHELLRELFGSRARFGFEPPLAYGDEPPPAVGEPEAIVLLFLLAQSPEREVHGVFVEELRQANAERPVPLLVLLDETRYRETASPERVEERLRAWRRVLADVGVDPVSLFGDAAPDRLLEDARARLGAARRAPA